MSKNDALAISEPKDFLSLIEKLATDPRVNIETLERILAMQERVEADRRKVEYEAAMSRLQAKLPQMQKYGQAKNSKFAKLEDIAIVMTPLLSEEGFSISFDEEANTEKTTTFIMRVAHQMGHAETKRLTVPIDTASLNREGKGIRPAIQDMGSTVSYARRYLLKMHFNIVERDEDSNGESLKTINRDQAKDLDALITEVGADRGRFLTYMGCESLNQMLARDYSKAIMALESKRKK